MTGGLVNIRTAALLLAGCLGILPAAAREMRVQVHNACIPVMTDRPFNVVAEICVENRDAEPVVFDGVSVALGAGPTAIRAMPFRSPRCGPSQVVPYGFLRASGFRRGVTISTSAPPSVLSRRMPCPMPSGLP